MNMKTGFAFLSLVATLSLLPACGGGSDPSSDDGDSTATTDGDATEAADGDSQNGGTDGDQTAEDPFTSLDCSTKTPLCTLWYCNAKKTYDDLYAMCSTANNGFSDQDCAALKGCADTYKSCVAPYRTQCTGDSIPMDLITTCTSNLSSCERPYLN